jgi:hypothetical protein
VPLLADDLLRVESAILIEDFLPSRPAMGAQFLYTRSIARVNPYAPSFKGSPEVMFAAVCDSIASRRFRPTKKEEKGRRAGGEEIEIGCRTLCVWFIKRAVFDCSLLPGHSSSRPFPSRNVRAAALAECLKSASRPVEITGGRKSLGSF